MKKLLFAFMIICLVMSLSISVLSVPPAEPIDLGETKTITIPEPKGEVDSTQVYFEKEFLFTPEQSGTYRFLMSYEEDEEKPYDVFLDVPGPYLKLDHGIEFEATAGENYLLCFQYPNHDGRYPQITFFLGTPDMKANPKTNDLCDLLPVFCLLMSAGLLVTFKKFYHTEA